ATEGAQRRNRRPPAPPSQGVCAGDLYCGPSETLCGDSLSGGVFTRPAVGIATEGRFRGGNQADDFARPYRPSSDG
ncbi:MAG: hypothetical protein IJQ25_03520, partial [Oscillibacter sp.]|nr:hypothetical protein [Oscillibacter sp.]